MDDENFLHSIRGNAANAPGAYLQRTNIQRKSRHQASTTHDDSSNQNNNIPRRNVPQRQGRRYTPQQDNWRQPHTSGSSIIRRQEQSGSGQTNLNPNTRLGRNNDTALRDARKSNWKVQSSGNDVQQKNENATRSRRHNLEQNRNENLNETNHLLTNESTGRSIMGFKALKQISLIDSRDILEKIIKRKSDFLNRISNIEPKNKDMYVLVVEILSKACQSSFDELKQRLLLEVIKTSFISNLRSYLMDLPYTETIVKISNKYYWDNQNQFWQNFITFSESVFNMAPSVALQKIRPILEHSMLCLEELQTRHGFKLSDENQKRITELRKRITIFEQKDSEVKCLRNKHNPNAILEEGEPPENFRELSVVPSRDDLLVQKPYLRPNLVRGRYQDIEHYLDVQFRLLREDCFGPLRDGLLQYIDDPNRHKYDNIRVYRNVRFVGSYLNKNQIGVTIQLDENTMKRLRRVNWSHSKRFIFGSLLLLTNDGCRSFITATIIDRNVKYLSEGRIPISLTENAAALVSGETKTDAVYVMIESEVYFEPYQHVLKALQHPQFPVNIAMSKYIVYVEPEAKPPNYITNSTFYTVTAEGLERGFYVLQPNTWPSCEELELNESQYEAYKLALTHEFAVIQGPPGTGKTYLGVKVAQTLLNNRQANNKCLMLVICYTNHALDQFLEHILKITNSIVRIGGQSRNPAMEAISLNKLRQSNKIHNEALTVYFSEKHNLKMIMAELHTAQNRIQSLHDGVLSYESIQDYIPEAVILKSFYSVKGGDIIRKWLFEHMPYVDMDKNILDNNKTDIEELPSDSDNESEENSRTATILDQLWDNDEVDINGKEIKTTFLLHEAEKRLKHLISYYKRNNSKQEMQNLIIEVRELNSRVRFFKEMRNAYKTNGVFREIREGENLKQLSDIDRWRLYFTWTKKIITEITKQIQPLQNQVNSAMTAFEEARMNLDYRLIQSKKVVGLTTSGAARLRKLLQVLAPPIVIVEEAAEVLEQHIVTSLTSSCQHLILIGDHQQLRPSAAYIRLARHYNIDISLFERMVMNGIHSRRLSVQHRMRPEIAALISPHIYEDLINHPSVDAFPHVRGVTTDLFFYTHNYKEEIMEDGASRSNHKEADMTLGLANYIMQQGYQPEEVTILSAYTEQMFYMKKQRPKYAFLDKVKITVVDNYQGEESKIILLSLVRNNDENKIGFLGTENRICVALSRAKEGFYIFGNINTLTANSQLWAKIEKTLESTGSIGTELRLKCENHSNQFSLITSPKDFEKVPEGGCLLKCNYNLPACGHRCPRICHGYDRGHLEALCQMKCERVICELGHVCPLNCAQKCQPCLQIVAKTLPCNHVKQVYCHQEPNDPKILCTTMVTVELSACGHQARKPCHMDLKMVMCTVPCIYRVDSCGHQCRRHCHVNDDPDHEQYKCQKPCAKAKRGCTANLVGDRGDHQCPKMCYEDCDECDVELVKKRTNCRHSDRVQCCKDVNVTPCRKNCARTMECGHFCKKKCFEPCGDCNIMVKKVISTCKHTIEIPCKEEAKQEMCQKLCERKLACGHDCTERCGKKCDSNSCRKIINIPINSPCGHEVELPCNIFSQYVKGSKDLDVIMSHCNVPCNMTLKCGHVCPGTCAQCHQGRLHVPCTEPCHVTLICGHQCEEPCNQLCPPCKKPCEVKCAHSQCNKICGVPCVLCQEDCLRECVHGRCGRRCGEMCRLGACDVACPKQLPCGHPCHGLCGEPCPDICRVCNPDDFPKDFLGYDFDDDAKFIKLQDCSHLLEVDDADNLMQGDKETVMIRCCPFCRKPIINTYRYKDLVNEIYRTELNPIKERVYGTEAQVVEKRNILNVAITNLKDTDAEVIKENTDFSVAFKHLQYTFMKNKKASKLQLDMYFVYLEILHMMANYHKKFMSVNLIEMRKQFMDQIKLICSVLRNNVQKLSQQQQEDIGNEIKRMNSIIQLSKILSHALYRSTKEDQKVATAAKEAKSVVVSITIYDEEKAIDAMKKLEKSVKLSGIATREEHALIIKAIGLKQGHWFKCPNGHYYCIGECGGAMQVSKCIECGAAIGGERHTLLSTNKLARELDGSQFPAWSEQYNDMANFDFENL